MLFLEYKTVGPLRWSVAFFFPGTWGPFKIALISYQLFVLSSMPVEVFHRFRFYYFINLSDCGEHGCHNLK